MRRLCPLLAVVVVASPLAVAQDSAVPAPAVTRPATTQAVADRPAPTQAERVADALLAQRVAGQARQMLESGALTDGVFRQAAALFGAARQLDASDPSYPHLESQACIQAGDATGAIDALKAYRLLMPGDHGAQVTLIDLYTGRIPVAEKRLTYLKSVLDNPTIPPEVRAHVALRAAQLHAERSETKRATAMLDQAIRLNPLSPEALSAKYEATAATATPVERVSMLLGIVQSNPTLTHRADALADALADAGLLRPSLDWYAFVARAWVRQGRPSPHGFAVRYAAQFYLADRPTDADFVAKQMLAADPSDVDALLVRLLVTRTGPKDEYAAALAQAGAVLRGRVLATRRTSTTQPGAQPVEPMADPLPDLSEDVVRANQPDGADRKRALVATLGDLAWFQVYFANDPREAAKTLASLRQLAGDEAVTVSRLDGWVLLAQGRTQEATVKLSAVADRDPIAAMGVARILLSDETTRTDGQAAARKVLADAPSGLLGAIVWDGLRELGARRGVVNGADLIVQQLDKFPRRWLEIVDKPQAFYTVRGEPLRGSFAFGEPMLCRVTISNSSEFDITVGPQGVIKPDLWFDAQLRGNVQQTLPGVTYERLDQAMVLRAKASVSTVVRIDQGMLARYLASNPTPAVQVFVSVMTNPTPAGNGGIGVGPAGLRAQFPRIFARNPFAVNNDQSRAQLASWLNDGAPAEKFNAIELLGTIASMVRRNPDPKAIDPADPQAAQAATTSRQTAAQFAGMVGQARTDPLESVAAWAWYLFAAAAEGDDRARSVRAMLQADGWATRLTGVMASRTLGDVQARMLEKIATDDPEPAVRRLATAWLAAAREPQATTAPTSMPTSMPTTVPTSMPATMPAVP